MTYNMTTAIELASNFRFKDSVTKKAIKNLKDHNLNLVCDRSKSFIKVSPVMKIHRRKVAEILSFEQKIELNGGERSL